MSRHGMKGPHGGMRGGAKAKDFKGSLKKLVKYMSVYKVQMLFVAVFAVCGTVFNIVGPKILGKATTEIFNGLVSIGRIGNGFRKNRTDPSYYSRSVCSQRALFLYSGNDYDRNLTENDVPIEKRYYGKGQSDADGLF